MSATLPRTSMSTIDENLKRFFDCIASICGMIVFSPLFLIIMIIIKCDSNGPVIFSQERIGKGGKPFTLYNLSFSFLYTYNSCFSTLALAGRPLFLVVGLAFET